MEVMEYSEFCQREFIKRMRKLQKLSKVFLSQIKKYCKENKNCKVFYITLTFRDKNEFIKAKQELKTAIGRYIFYTKRNIEHQGGQLLAYFWVLEVQSRGVPHYHIFLLASKDVYIPYPDKSYWCWGISQLQVVSSEKISKSYLSKYLEKQEQKNIFELEFLKGMKMYNFYVNKKFSEFFYQLYRLLRSFSNGFIRRIYRLSGFLFRKKGGMYISTDENIKIKIKSSFIFFSGLVSIENQGLYVFYQGSKIFFESFEQFFDVFIFVYNEN